MIIATLQRYEREIKSGPSYKKQFHTKSEMYGWLRNQNGEVYVQIKLVDFAEMISSGVKGHALPIPAI